jgi:hypothetical protein
MGYKIVIDKNSLIQIQHNTYVLTLGVNNIIANAIAMDFHI